MRCPQRPPAARRIAAALLLAAALCTGCAVEPPAPAPPPPPTAPAPAPTDAGPPAAPREFRAAWVATVANIDWPSQPGLAAATQRAEVLAILDRARAIGLNAIVLQVRPAGDAIYPSALEPWSEWLGGEQGRAPTRAGEPAWDPLAFWIEQAHRRGLELHAWFNPFRARHPSATSELAPTHVAKAEPGIVEPYGEWLWMDPGEPRAAERMRAVVLDVVQRYDVDGVHIDDYFYPYPVPDGQGGERPFPDDAAWLHYLGRGGTLERADWRRDNVNRLIETLYGDVHRAKPWVRFGISPFGLPRPDRRPAGIEGFSQFDKLYADVEHWLQQGWLDYLAPQLYWPIAQTAQAFEVLLDNWLQANARGRHVWPGLFTSRIGAPTNAYAPRELLAQLDALRARRGAGGHLHFSMAALLNNREGIADLLREGPYAEPALPPATPWLDEPAPGPLQVGLPSAAPGAPALALLPAQGAPLRHVVRWQRKGRAWSADPLPALGLDAVPLDPDADIAVLAGVGRTGKLGPRLRLVRQDGAWRLPST